MKHPAIIAFLIAASLGEPVSANPTLPPLDTRPRVSVVAHEVTLNGENRADIAQAITDSLSATLIKSNDYRVFQSRPQPGRGRKKRDAAYGSAAPEKLPLPAVAANTASDFIYSFNVLGEEGTYRLTLKKEVASTAEVLCVEETRASGNLEMLFTMVPTTLRQLETKGKPQASAFPRTQSPAQSREVIRPAVPIYLPREGRESPGLREFYAAQSRVPTEYGHMELKDVPKALTYQPMGAIQFINNAWKFCIIQPAPGHKFAVNQHLDVLYDEDGRPYGSLKVDALDSGKLVAGYGRTPFHHPLFSGDVVYGWAPPLK